MLIELLQVGKAYSTKSAIRFSSLRRTRISAFYRWKQPKNGCFYHSKLEKSHVTKKRNFRQIWKVLVRPHRFSTLNGWFHWKSLHEIFSIKHWICMIFGAWRQALQAPNTSCSSTFCAFLNVTFALELSTPSRVRDVTYSPKVVTWPFWKGDFEIRFIIVIMAHFQKIKIWKGLESSADFRKQKTSIPISTCNNSITNNLQSYTNMYYWTMLACGNLRSRCFFKLPHERSELR